VKKKSKTYFKNKKSQLMILVVGNLSGYGYSGSENYEHDDTGSIHNFSGVEDDVYSSISEHENWEEGYDY
jgi:hypothetical protein